MDFRKQLEKHAINIGDELLEETQKTSQGWYWKTVKLDEDNDPIWDISEGLYSGSGGIVLFFLELYKHTNEDKYLDAVEKGTEWLIWYCEENPTDYYAFFTGRMGVSYLMLQCYKVLEEEKYLDYALKIGKDCESFLHLSNAVNDLINGISGTLLGLLHLHSVAEEDWVLDKITLFVGQLLDEVKYAETGIYWDLSRNHTKPLCGFSHGSSGIGYVFLELGYYFDNQAFFRVAEKAFEYENGHFDEGHQNWPDFRKGVFDDESYEEHKEAYLDNDLDFFFDHTFMSAWCHGAPGIGLSRVRALELLGEEKYRRDLERAIGHTYHLIENSSTKATSTLCHGRGGNALLFVDAFNSFDKEKHLEYAHNAAQQAIKSRQAESWYISGYSVEEKKEDSSLFMGKAGVGYFYLQCLKESNGSVIVAPSLEKKANSNTLPPELKQSEKDIRQKLLASAFPRTLGVLTQKFEEEFDQFLESQMNNSDLKSSFKEFITVLNNNEDLSPTLQLVDIFKLENQKLQQRNNSNPSYLYIQDDIQKKSVQNILQLTDGDILKAELKLNATVSFITTKWNWDINTPDLWVENFDQEPDLHHTILIRRVGGVEEFGGITEFTRLVFEAFKQPKIANQAIGDIAESAGIDKADGQSTILGQIKEGIKARILASI